MIETKVPTARRKRGKCESVPWALESQLWNFFSIHFPSSSLILNNLAIKNIFMTADLIFFNGTLITMDPLCPSATFVAISQNKIVGLGQEADIPKWKNAKTQMIDLQGAYVYPGFIDSHAHIQHLAHTQKESLHFGNCDTKLEVIEMVKKQVEKSKPGQWILGVGWNDDLWTKDKNPTAKDLDVISPHNPVFLVRIDSHLVWVNSLAMKLANITPTAEEVEGGKIFRDSQGNPTGLFLDRAIHLIQNVMPEIDFNELMQSIAIALKECVQLGITMIHNAATFDLDYKIFEDLSSKNLLPLRIYAFATIPSAFGDKILQQGPKKLSPFFEVRGIKLFMDGALGSRGAALIKPYSDDPTTDGLILWKEEDFLNILKQAKEKGLQVAVHAIGDRANRLTLDAFEKIGPKGLRFRIEHAQILDKKDLPRFKALGVLAAVQPLHATEDMCFVEKRMGPERVNHGAYAWRSLLEHKAILSGGSDAPIASINPLLGIYAAITRQNKEGEIFTPQEKITAEEVLKMYTINGAYACFREHELGSITPGKLADLTILPKNLLTCDPKEMLDMLVHYTVIDGKIAYQNVNR